MKKNESLFLPDCHSGELKHFVVSLCECGVQLGRVLGSGTDPRPGTSSHWVTTVLKPSCVNGLQHTFRMYIATCNRSPWHWVCAGHAMITRQQVNSVHTLSVFQGGIHCQQKRTENRYKVHFNIPPTFIKKNLSLYLPAAQLSVQTYDTLIWIFFVII